MYIRQPTCTSSLDESVIFDTLTQNQVNDSTKHDEWLASHPEQVTCAMGEQADMTPTASDAEPENMLDQNQSSAETDQGTMSSDGDEPSMMVESMDGASSEGMQP